MLFYKITAEIEKTVTDTAMSSRDIRAAERERNEDICAETDDFWGNNPDWFLFVNAITFRKVILGAVSMTPIQNKLIRSFLSRMHLPETKFQVSEITLDNFQRLLTEADRNGLVSDDDTILDRFELDYRHKSFRDVWWEDVLVPETSRKRLLAQCDKLMSSSLSAEVGRILEGATIKNLQGHPAHYLIETDSDSFYQDAVNLLHNALLKTGRVQSRRRVDITARKINTNLMKFLYYCGDGGMVCTDFSNAVCQDSEFASEVIESMTVCTENLADNYDEVLSVIHLPKACNKLKNILFEMTPNCTFVEIFQDSLTGDAAKQYLKQLAEEKHIQPSDSLYRELDTSSDVYTLTDLQAMFFRWYDQYKKTVVYPQYAQLQTAGALFVKEKPAGSAYDELQKLIGLEKAKTVIEDALNYHKALKLFRDRGLQEDHPAMHMVFTGNPGTAKTTVARLFARIMKENGILSEGQLYEVGRSDLVGKYVGWTAPTVKQKFKQAKGSVLFIDEAYSLLDGRDGLFGDEAINTIVQEMENCREDTIVIFAGYPGPMEEFLSRNPGLRSRIAYTVPFEDYTPAQLFEITQLITKQKGMTLAPSVEEKLLPIFRQAAKDSEFGNGRFARNLVERAKVRQATRLVSMQDTQLSRDTVTTLQPEDFEAPAGIMDKPKRTIGFAGWG